MSEEEREAVQSLFCHPGECEFHENEIIINTGIDGFNIPGHHAVTVKPRVKIVFHIGKDYPQQFPEISVFSETLDRKVISRVKSEALQNCSDLLGEPMLISLLSCIQENIQLELQSKLSSSNQSDSPQGGSANTDGNIKLWTGLLHIDHMRSKNRYCKTLEKWAADLDICGKILFCNKLILVLLQGDIGSIKDFIVKLKTVSIDVDSKGHSCKEKMMTVLCEVQHTDNDIDRLDDFERRELKDREKLEILFRDIGLLSLYKEHVARLH